MPLFKKGSRGGLTSGQIVLGDFKTDMIDTDLTSVSSSDDTFASAKAVKTYVDNIAAASLTGLTDTTIASLGDNNHLQYDGTTSKWVNKTYLEFDKISAPAAPGTEEGRLYLKEIDSNNNALAIKLQKAGTVVEVELTSPGCVCECGSTDGARDPLYDFANGKMIVELYCGHSYEMDIPGLRRIK